MRINYNSWFYEQHRYLQGSKDGYTSYNDTKWNNIFRRMKTLVDLQSQLIHEQPFSVVANYAGMNRLVGLLDKTDYTFQDINDALVATYKRSLKNAMSNMVVNTHAVIATGKNTDENITRDPMNTDYYVIDVPYQQLHFGDRDEVIRQQLQNMFARSRNNYLTSTDFINEDLVNLMGFTLICACNGLISHDWMVALDDKGFHFKIAWRKSYDCDFIIYKLDKTIVKTFTVDRPTLQKNNVIEASIVDIPAGTKCIINIYDPQYPDDSAPNFGTMTDAGIVISGLQFTPTALGYTNTRSVTAVVYGLKYLHEVPNVYPSVNYFDMMRDQTVYTKDGTVSSDTGNVTGRVQHITADTLCTPPICVDRPVIDSFNTILQCIKMRERLNKHSYRFNKISTRTTAEDPVAICQSEKEYMESELVIYKRGGILTSWLSVDDIAYFQNVIDRMQAFIDSPGNGFAEASPANFRAMVNRICGPFERDSVKVFRDLSTTELTRRYFMVEEDLATRINRPISEQCIIALKYNPDNSCWVFTAPDIKHFHGIGNTFYIDTGLTFGEVYKFFFLYTDTEAPSETNIEQMPFDTVFDYDKFEYEVDKHLGYIRYWNVENHLRKLSKILYSDDSTEIQNQVLSEMLRKKFNGDEFIDTYPSDINYEQSNASTLNVDGGESDEEAPFAVNFLFYTVSMMFNNSDTMLAYFISRLNKEDNRYDDIPFVEPVGYRAHVNFAVWQRISRTIDATHSLKDGKVHIYYGYPGAVGTDGETMTLGAISSSYRGYDLTFHDEPDHKYPLIRDDGTIDEEYYITATSSNLDRITHISVRLSQYCSEYMQRVLDALVYIRKYNVESITRGNIIQTYYDRIIDKYNELIAYANEHRTEYGFPAYVRNAMETIQGSMSETIAYANTVRCPGFPKNMDWYSYINKFLSILRSVYDNIGFDDVANARVKSLYDHLSKINSGLPIAEFIQWLEDIDLTILTVLDSMVSNNPTVKRALNLSSTYFMKVHDVLVTCIETTRTAWCNFVQNAGNDYSNQAYYIMYEFVYNDMMTFLKTNYVLDRIDFEEFVLDTKPAYICILFDNCYEYRYGYASPNTNQYLVFKPDVVEKQDGFHVTGLRPICEYSLFADKDWESNLITYLRSYRVDPIDDYGNLISYTGTPCYIKIKQISVTCDDINTIEMLPNTSDSVFDFQNIHSTHDVVDGNVVNTSNAAINYELVAGGRFIPLKHETEMILDRETFEPKPIDRVRVSNFDVNTFVRNNLCDHQQALAYIKPLDVHIIFTPGVFGRYEVGDTVCVKLLPTTAHFAELDPKYAFTAKVTDITHTEDHSAIEIDVDQQTTQWKTETLHDYIYFLGRGYQLGLDCMVVEDNFRNFMDEFNNSAYSYYPVPPLPNGEVTPETLQGDPLFVSEYSDYVYTRLNWFFSPNVPNRFPDDAHKTYDFVYIGAGSFIPTEGMTVKLLNHNWNTMDLAEMYPVLKDNHGEQAITEKEKQTFENLITETDITIHNYQQELDKLLIEYGELTNTYEKQMMLIQIDELRLKIKQSNAFKTRLQDYIEQPELPATWYNLYSYDDAIAYINNGRATGIRIPRSRVYDALYTDSIEVKLYDWEHKVWINPDEYTVSLTKAKLYAPRMGSSYYNSDPQDNVHYTLTITPTSNTFSSRKVLVYFVYKTSDIYDDIPDGAPYYHSEYGSLSSWFKYGFETGDTSKFNNVYDIIKIRKHYDTNESYRLIDYVTENDSYIVDRIRRSGKYSFVSNVRWSDVTIKTGATEYTLDDFDVYYEFPYPNVETPQKLKSVSYTTSIITDIDDATDGDIVTLIAMNNNEYTVSDGSTSSVLFLARINIVDEHLTVTILDSTIGIVDGNFRCFVAKDPSYKSCGGIINVVSTVNTTDVTLDETGKWYKVTNSIVDRIVHDRFMLIPHGGVVVNDTTSLELHNNYELDTDGNTNAYMYFYDTKYQVRYPMSNITLDDYHDRLEIDTTENTNVKKIKSNYMGICRYSLQRIPSNGLIDLTGYIATPLTRSNYEFWINGRCLNNTKNLIILSPTVIQLTNLTSLRNFEVIELVHDVNDSELRPTGPIYSDLSGNMFGSYIQALASNKAIRYQTVKYAFGTNTQSEIDKYANDIVLNPNNIDVETDIMSFISTDGEATSYNELYNIPSINGIPLRHPTIEDLGMTEIPNSEIISRYNKTWAYEICTRVDFPLTHMDLLNSSERVRLHASIFDNQYRVYTTGICSKYFTLFISNTIDGTPTQVIPMIQLGTSILLPVSYEGKWIRCTFPGTVPIQLK